MTAPAPLGPGDTDPHSKVTTPAEVKGPLAPGEDDERTTRGEGKAVQPPPSPGAGEESEYEMRPLPPLAPGDLQVPRPAVRFKRKAKE